MQRMILGTIVLICFALPPSANHPIYVSVDDIDAYLKKCDSLGGKTLVPKVEIPNYGSFAWISDPDRNA
jgi:predicted enzyme related to lactoylglutathione lyase